MRVEWTQSLRPRTWEDVAGQDSTVEFIRKFLAQDNFPKYTIFHGPSGAGKSCIAELVAKDLTCVAHEGRPCGKCQKCIAAERGASPAIRKFNMAKLVGKRDILEVLESIFEYEGLSDKTVYILEEVHVLKQKEEQSPFLEELTKIPEDVYIIMCTTQPYRLIPELHGRAVSFELEPLSAREAIRFVKQIASRMNVKLPDPYSLEVFVRMCEYNPRQIVKNLELLVENDELKDDVVKSFFKSVNDDMYVTLLECMLDPSLELYDFIVKINGLLDECNSVSLMRGLETFLWNALYEVSLKKVFTTLTATGKKRMASLLTKIGEADYIKLIRAVSEFSPVEINDRKRAPNLLVKLRFFVQDVNTKTVFRGNNEKASTQHVKAMERSAHAQRDTDSNKAEGVQELGHKDIQDILNTYGGASSGVSETHTFTKE